ncbi:MAG TPA: TolC family protein [Polyangia bacterium]|jgi:outer membrane protein TolC|nr:TolC family protein [Polyangia bacterium]
MRTASFSLVLVLLGAATGRADNTTIPAVTSTDTSVPAPVADAPERVSFDVAVQRALARNPQALIAQAEVKRAWSLLEEARAPSLPNLAAQGYYQRIEGNRGASGVVALHDNELYGALNVSMALLAPAQWATWAHSRDNVEIARLSAADVRRKLAVAVAHTYLTIVAQHRVIDVQERARANAQAHLDYTHARFVGGIGPQLDETRAAQELDADVSQLEVTYGQIVLQQEALGVLLGVNRPVDSELDVTLETPPQLDEALGDSRKLRTDLRLAQERLVASQHRVRDDYTDYLPTIVGSFAPFLYTPSTTSTPGKGFVGLLSLNLPLYDGGLRYGEAHERASLRDEAAIDHEGVERQVASDVRASYVELNRALRSFEAARSSARRAQAALSMTNQAYKAGATTNIEVIDAETRARDADTSAAQAEDAARQATIDLLAASGRFPR